MISKSVAKELNAQINREFNSAYKYFGMSAYFEQAGLAGFANWFKIQAAEEIQHGLKIYHYMLSLSEPVTLLPIAAPKNNFKNHQEVFELAVEAEKDLAKDFNRIAELALSEHDQLSYSFLKWFLDEQVEEIALTTDALGKIKLVGTHGEAIYLLDKEFGSRQKV